MPLRSFKVFRQLDAMDCGPTCLKMILNHHGKNISRQKLREITEIDKRGVSLLSMSIAAEKFGFRTLSAKVTIEELINRINLPCILHWNKNHFVILWSITKKNKFKVADPAKGLVTYGKDEFSNAWISSQKDGVEKGTILTLTPTSEFYKIEDDGNDGLNWNVLRKYVLTYKSHFLQIALGLLFGSLLQVIFPYLTQSIVDTGIQTQNLEFITVILIAQFTLLISLTAVEFIRSRILLYVSTHINLNILSDFWIKLMRLPLQFFDTKSTGDILQRINDHKRIEGFVTGSALQTVFSFFNLILFSIVLLTYDLFVFITFLVGSGLYILWIFLFLRYRRKLDFKRFGAASKENSLTIQLINGMREIKLNGAEQLERWKWQKVQARLFNLNFKFLTLDQYQQAGAVFLNQGKNLFITYIVAKLVVDGQLTLGAMIAIQYIIGQLSAPVEQLINFTRQLQDAKISLERLNDIHTLEDEEPTGKMFSNQISEEGDISFSNMSYSYPGVGNLNVIENFTTSIPQGKVTAIVGTSGSGKTTLLKILLKVLPNYKGKIDIGKENFNHLSPSYWRGLCGSVMQDGFVFNDTISRNIALGEEVYDYPKLKEAAQIACILEFIESLPQGFNTVIGVDGIGLSTGQKQRILIARAIYKNPTYLFFDEATNALDASNEKQIIKNLQSFYVGRTVLIVAHRLSTVKQADKIIVLGNGKIMEEGSHGELIKNKGNYFQLVENQLELQND